MNQRTERILFAIGFIFSGMVLALLILLVAASTASAAPSISVRVRPYPSVSVRVSPATCTPATWQARTNIHNVRCTRGWCTGRLAVCGTWGCASTSSAAHPAPSTKAAPSGSRSPAQQPVATG